ncbi:hypothetical protein [Pontibacter rugosus]|uniref:Uncharacterized protein n=1 Tax=Pontibacter rugosus TaxID=1745966 RepID=A0ABW3SS10_9BACT
MKKFLTLALVAMAITANTQSAFANGNLTSTDKNKVVALLVHTVDRSTIKELQLNEMQYIQLKDLHAKYLQDVELMKVSFMNNTALLEIRKQETNNRYYTELSNILTPTQVGSYLSKQAIASVK